MKYIDYLLDRVTMYRLVLYILIGMLLTGFLFMVFGLIPYNPIDLLFNTLLILALCWLTNQLFSLVFQASTNIESVYITALILALIIPPTSPFANLPLLITASVISMASKYILAFHKKHIFNPAAIGVLLASIVVGSPATWWVGTTLMVPVVLAAGFFLWRKVKKVDMVLTFILVSLLTLFVINLSKGSDWFTLLNNMLLHSSFLFFAVIMLTEPMTMPPTYNLQLIYAAIVGVLFVPDIHLVSIYSTPELALIMGNIFAYIVSPKEKLLLTLKQKLRLSADEFEFVFTPDIKPTFEAGQYMEFTLPHPKPDTRGNRRYFTLSSSPTEETVEIGVKFAKQSSTFKYNLANMQPGSKLIAGQLSGEFVLPKDTTQKLVFMAGGIGITPYRSMIKYLLDKHESRPITLFYSNNTKDDIVYEDIFNQAQKELGIKVVYTLTKPDLVPSDWKGEVGFIDREMIETKIPDYKESYFYVSGPHVMVVAMEDVLHEMKVSSKHIKTDFFPGYV